MSVCKCPYILEGNTVILSFPDMVDSRLGRFGVVTMAVYNHWTGPLDWTAGLDSWTGLLDHAHKMGTRIKLL